MSKRNTLLLLILVLLLCGAFTASLMLGRTVMSWGTLVLAFTDYDAGAVDQLIVRTERLARAVIALAVGASLSVAGTLMQAMTRNPLASPDVFGISSGAILLVVLAVLVNPATPLIVLSLYAVGGAILAAVIVYALGSLGRDGLTPVKLVLAGSAITALFASCTQALLVMNDSGLQDVLFWLAGSISGRSLENVRPLLPFIVLAGLIAVSLGRALNLLTTGEDIAKGLGQRTLLVKLLLGGLIVVLAGGSVAMVGAVGFIGLFVPHMARGLAGNDYRWVLPFSAVLGAGLLLLADVAARLLIQPSEVPIGVMTAAVGVPFFIHVARKGGAWR
ncbi:FecCD family ABC transporter permease [Paenibacillus sonchi]|uniref:FecCD family ABC transporter permease n=1 Tax=Paenibacillus sonchi TaxID=373687 RepID=UPI001E49372E|nr:iron ABC transporter permease [Paenibacillus sonchi]MCE3199728.1 iron ABC transporter permease [Paenibacillus sonchi]